MQRGVAGEISALLILKGAWPARSRFLLISVSGQAEMNTTSGDEAKKMC